MYYCNQCPDKSWTNSKNRNNHILRVHEGRKFKCHICGHEYLGERNFKWHLDYHNSPFDGDGTRRRTLRPEKEVERQRRYKMKMKMKKNGLKN
jgi:hypothetical protein